MGMNCTRTIFVGSLLLLVGYVGVVLLFVPTVTYTAIDAKNESCEKGWLWSVIPAYTSVPFFVIATTVLLYGANRKPYQTQCCSVFCISGISLVFLGISGISLHLTSFRVSSCSTSHEHIQLWYYVPVLIGNFLMIFAFKVMEMSWITQHLPKRHTSTPTCRTQSVYTQNKLIVTLCIAMVVIGYCVLVVYCSGKLLADFYVYKVLKQDFTFPAVLYYLPAFFFPLGSSFILAYLLCSENKQRLARVGSIFVSIAIMNSAALTWKSLEEIWGSNAQYANETYYQKVNAVALTGSALIAISSALLKLLWVLIIKQQSVTQYSQVPVDEMEGDM